MASYGKTKGAAFERLIRSYFNDAGITAKNPARATPEMAAERQIV